MEQITPQAYVTAHRDELLLDVRSPAEYAHGHIPGAINLPLFSDEERAIVGTIYKKEGKEPAVQKGLMFVSPRLVELVEQVQRAFEALSPFEQTPFDTPLRAKKHHCFLEDMFREPPCGPENRGYSLEDERDGVSRHPCYPPSSKNSVRPEEHEVHLEGSNRIGVPTSRTLVIYCARGGMRSRSLGMLLECANNKVYQLSGGYKAYKQYLRTTAMQRTNLILIGGKTGSGKTALLHELAQLGEAVIDLEGEAHHKGSTYGALGQQVQPTQEQFIVSLLTKLILFDPQKPVWLEHEGNRLGNLFVPQELWDNMIKAPIILIEVPFEYRKKRLIDDYGSFSKEQLLTCTSLLEQRLGGAATKAVCTAINEGATDRATTLLMEHYDRSYGHATEREKNKGKRQFISLELKGDSPYQHAQELRDLRERACSLT